jgi:hypothetical protein
MKNTDFSPKGGYGHNNDLWSEILPGLWMGGTSDQATLGHSDAKLEITPFHFDTVATLYASAVPVDWYVKELRLGFYDHDQVDIDQHDLDQLVASLYSDWQAGKRVLIRCQAGWDLIRRMRSPNALCNSTFEQYLKEQESSSVGV